MAYFRGCVTTESKGGPAQITWGLLPSAAVDRALTGGGGQFQADLGFLALHGSSIGQKRSDMRVSDVFALAGDSGSGGNSYSNFGCSAGDCYAGDYGRYSYNYYSDRNNASNGSYINNGPYNGGLRNASATGGDGYNRVQG
jgi:hypothetical protein